MSATANLERASFCSRSPIEQTGAYRRVVKPVLDKTLVVLALPFILIIVGFAALLTVANGSKPFYSQMRVGRNGVPFRMWKIRTMVDNADQVLEAHLAQDPVAGAEWATTQKLKNDPRVTRIGRVLRRTSIDELPQMWNVLNGTMALVGPRPIMVNQRHLYQGAAYYGVRPGITGFWQVSERNEGSFKERVVHDERYVVETSLLTDLRILIKTVRAVVRSTGY